MRLGYSRYAGRAVSKLRFQLFERIQPVPDFEQLQIGCQMARVCPAPGLERCMRARRRIGPVESRQPVRGSSLDVLTRYHVLVSVPDERDQSQMGLRPSPRG